MSYRRVNPFTFSGLFEILKRNFMAACVTIGICCCVSLLALYYVPSRYESSATLSIPSTYFKNPVVNDVMPEITESGEIETLKRSLFKRAMSDDFIDAIGEKYGLFEHPLDAAEHIKERRLLHAMIRYVPADLSQFHVVAAAPSADTAQAIVFDVLDKLRFTLTEERFATFTQARNAIQAELEILERRASAKLKAEIELLRVELESANAAVQELREKYTESHPEFYQMQKRAQELRDKILGKESAAPQGNSAETESQSQISYKSLYDELTHKLTFLSVALSIEKGKKTISFLNIIEEPNLPTTAVYPRAGTFLQYGFAISLLLVLAQTMYFEYKRSQFFDPQDVAEVLGVPFLGKIPTLEQSEWQCLIEHASLVRVQRLLPPP